MNFLRFKPNYESRLKCDPMTTKLKVKKID